MSNIAYDRLLQEYNHMKNNPIGVSDATLIINYIINVYYETICHITFIIFKTS